MENRNKIIAIIITFVLMVGLLVGGYFLFYKKSSTNTTTNQAQLPATQVILTKISDDAVLSPEVSYDHNAVWYFDSNGNLFRRAFDNSTFEQYGKFPSALSNFTKAYWPTNGDDVILESSSNGALVRNYFNEKTGTYTQLPANVKSLDWMPDGLRIAYIWQSNDKKSQQLIIANADTSGFHTVANVFWPDFMVKVSPDGKNALLVRSPAQDTNAIYEVSLDTGKFATVVATGKNFEAEWVSNDRFIYTQSVNGKSEFELFDLTANKSTDLNIAATLDKVAVDATGKFLYADVRNGNSDVISKVDLTSLQAQQVYKFDSTIVPHNLFMDDQTICFINVLDGKLYTLTQ